MSTIDEKARDNVLRAVQLALGVSTQRITVKVKDGQVFLYGYAYSLEERASLETIALSVPGVSSVENQLCVNLFA
jgi:osmotically-inducible protein OsmY